MNRLANKTVTIAGVGSTAAQPVFRRSIDLLANVLTRLGLLRRTPNIICCVRQW